MATGGIKMKLLTDVTRKRRRDGVQTFSATAATSESKLVSCFIDETQRNTEMLN